ncbi:sodium channel protein type 4 subunit alpha B-like [Clavelina lepadiformis]|uniref:sodium channel protein type 4 subunit alpha B-like n=1 Tax=Clavelina lepadiformis TaxID=159417 RepID=UPI004041CB92
MSLELLDVAFVKLTRNLIKEQERRIANTNDRRRKKTFKEDEAEEASRKLDPVADLEQGKTLPEYLQGDVEESQLCVPLVDPDPYYHDKNTFIILDNKYSIYRFSASRALLCISPLNFVRRAALKTLINPFFNGLIMLTIVVNCIFMAMDTESMPWVDTYVEKIFLGIYTFEMIVKILSRGFVFAPFTYMRDPWNVLDISVIVTAYLDIALAKIGEGGKIPGMAALRAFRVLRALKAISVIPGLKAIVSALIESVKALKDVMILTLFCLAVFALIGLQLFKGSLLKKCIKTWPPDINSTFNKSWYNKNLTLLNFPIFVWDYRVDPELLLSQFALLTDSGEKIAYSSSRYNESIPGHLISLPMPCDGHENITKCPKQDILFWNNDISFADWVGDECNYCYVNNAPLVCGSGSAGKCWDGYSCYEGGINPNFGYTSYDTFYWAFLSLFRLMAQDYWENLYQLTIRSNGQLYLIFFMVVIFLGSFYLVNLILAVVAMAYEEQHQIIAEEDERKKKLVELKKKQLESIRNELERELESRQQSRRASHATDSGGRGSPALSATGFHHHNSSINRNKRPSKSSQREKKQKEKDARRTATDLAREIARDASDAPPHIRSGLINDAVAQIHQSNHDDLEAAHIPHPHSILKSPNITPRPSLRGLRMSPIVRKREFICHTDDSVELVERCSRFGKRKSSNNSGHDSDFGDDEHSDHLSIDDVILGKSPHVDKLSHHVHMAERDSNGTAVDRNGTVSIVHYQRHPNNCPDVLLHNVNEMESLSIDSEQNHMDTLRPSTQRQRMYSIDLLSDSELLRLREQARSRVSLMSEKEEESGRLWRRITRLLLIWECCGCWVKVQKFMRLICDDPFFDLMITLCIVVNTTFMAMEKHPATDEYKVMLLTANNVFTVIFAMEMVIKMIGLQPYYYFQEAWNCFDSIIVSVSLLELVMSDLPGVSVLRTFRLMRVFKLAKSWPTLNMLIKIIGNSMGSLGNLTLVLCILLFIFAVVGMQLFRDKYKAFDPEGAMRWHMKDFSHSFLIVFRILCGEWIETMWDCMETGRDATGFDISAFCIPFFMLVQVVGNLVVLNLFLALLLSSFSADSFSSDTSEEEPPNSIQLSVIRIKRWIVFIRSKARSCKETIVISCRRKLKGSPESIGLDVKAVDSSCNTNSMQRTDVVTVLVEPPSTCAFENDGGVTSRPANTLECRYEISFHHRSNSRIEQDLTKDVEKVPIASLDSDFENKSDSESDDSSVLTKRSGVSDDSESCTTISNSEYERMQIDGGGKANQADNNTIADEPASCWPQKCVAKFPFCDPPIPEDGCCRVWWNARKICFRIVEHSWFETFIIFMILLSSAALAFEDVYYHDRKQLKSILKYADRIFTYVFIFEMLLKWVAYGFKKYFTNAWCWLDFFIVGVSIVGLVAEMTNLNNVSSIRSLRTLRALRPLRAMSRFEGMKVVVNALIGAIPSIVNVLLVCLIFWLIFSIMGVNLFAGKFQKCLNRMTGEKLAWKNYTHVFPDNSTQFYENINKTVCYEINQFDPTIVWTNNNVNFDNAFGGYLALMQVATFKGWMAVMYDAVDMTAQDEQPSFEYSVGAYYYFVAFIVFGSFFTLNLFIGVIIENFNQQKKKLGGQDIFMTEEQRKYYNAMKKLGSKKPQKPVPRPKNKFQAWVFDIITHQMFEIAIMILIIANMITMMIEYHNMPPDFTAVLEYINYVFVAIFTGEAIIKIFALRHHYFKNPWNVFDFVVVILSIGGSAMGELLRKYFVQPTLFRIIRLARVGRILRLIKGAKGIRTLLFALMMSLPALVNIALLLMLVMFIYSIFGMSQFAFVHRGGIMDDLFNFETFANSFLCLFMVTTSAGWAGLLMPILQNPPDCNPDLRNRPGDYSRGDCGNSSIGVFLFVTYLIITFLIVVNMYIAIILENFGVATEESTDPLGEDDFEMFYEVWERFDAKATQFISYEHLSDFVDSLEPPLRVAKPNGGSLTAMDLPMVMGDRLHCLDVLFALTKMVLGESEELEGLRSQMEDKFMASNPSKASYEPITTTLRRKQEELSTVKIQKWWRKIRIVRSVRMNSSFMLTSEKGSFDDDDNANAPGGVTLSDQEKNSNDNNGKKILPPPTYDRVVTANNSDLYSRPSMLVEAELAGRRPDAFHQENDEFLKLMSSTPSTTSPLETSSFASSTSTPHGEAAKGKQRNSIFGDRRGSSDMTRTPRLENRGASASFAPEHTESDAENNNDGANRESDVTFVGNVQLNDNRSEQLQGAVVRNDQTDVKPNLVRAPPEFPVNHVITPSNNMDQSQNDKRFAS